MPWWGWVAVGLVLLGSELLLVDAQFYLVFLGVAAALVGFAVLVVDAPLWSQWLSFAAIAVLSMVFFRGRVYELLRRPGPAPEEALVGSLARARGRIGPGERGSAELRGSLWTVLNDGDRPLEPGGEARVERAEGVVLHVRPL